MAFLFALKSHLFKDRDELFHATLSFQYLGIILFLGTQYFFLKDTQNLGAFRMKSFPR